MTRQVIWAIATLLWGFVIVFLYALAVLFPDPGGPKGVPNRLVFPWIAVLILLLAAHETLG